MHVFQFKPGMNAGSHSDQEVCTAHVLPLALTTTVSGPRPGFAFSEQSKCLQMSMTHPPEFPVHT